MPLLNDCYLANACRMQCSLVIKKYLYVGQNTCHFSTPTGQGQVPVGDLARNGVKPSEVPMITTILHVFETIDVFVYLF